MRPCQRGYTPPKQGANDSIALASAGLLAMPLGTARGWFTIVS